MSMTRCDACGGADGRWPMGNGDLLCGRCVMAQSQQARQAREALALNLDALPSLPALLDELEECDFVPMPGAYCAAGYLTWLENHANEWVPLSHPVLCEEHESRMRQALLFDHPWLLDLEPAQLAAVYAKQRETILAAAVRQANRAAEKLSREQ